MADFPFKPQVVGWELTLRCNMRCLHCGSTAGQPRPDELTVEEGFSLIDQMVDLGTEIVTLSGGEPMTHPAWDQYAKRLIDKGVKTYMISNGLLLEQNIERLRACGMRRLGVSIDGDEPMHDYIRNHPGTFKAAMRGIAAAHEAGIKVGAVTHISGANKHLLEAMYNVMLQNKLDFWQIQIAFSQGRMKDHPQYALSPEDLPMIVNFVHKCQEEGKLPVVAGDNFGYYEVPAMRAKPWKGCFAGRHLMGVDADGKQTDGCYSLKKLYSQLGALNAHSVVVFLDACFSGSKRDDGMLVAARGVAVKPKEEAPTGNMIIFSAASGDETAMPYKEKGHGLFTYYLLKKLQDTKGDVTLSELGKYIKTNVRQKSTVVNKKPQTPSVVSAAGMTGSWENLKMNQ